jgi:hypothetical protein
LGCSLEIATALRELADAVDLGRLNALYVLFNSGKITSDDLTEPDE